jgi:CelD/BcsL family acetyltransferase involved in cellulose biosynthesis
VYCLPKWSHGRVLRLLGDGEVCSDHTGLLAASNYEAVAGAIAAAMAERTDWDLLDFHAVDADDAHTTCLLDSLAVHGCQTTQLQSHQCWTINLPATWDEFLAMQSKSHRKQLRQMDGRVLQSERARWTIVERADEFATVWSSLVDLHQRRRQSLGEPGCFASSTWASFHWEIAQQSLAHGRLRLSVLELDGHPVAAEYHLANAKVTYAYQGGVDPDHLSAEPGQLSTICSIQRAISEGHTQFDLLRGDEPYKAHWRAAPKPAMRLTAVPPRLWPQLRHQAFRRVRGASRFAKQFTGLFS